MSSASKRYRWGLAWLSMVSALALHVTEEALRDFLPWYNSTIERLREIYPVVPFPTFTFPVWLGGLAAGIVILFALSPFVFSGRSAMRWLTVPLAVVMILNALGHMAVTLYTGRPAPGVWSSPVLLLAAIALLGTTIGMRRGSDGRADPQ
jgi:cation transport ATPase